MLIGILPRALDRNMLSKTLYDNAHSLLIQIGQLPARKQTPKTAYSPENMLRRWEE